MMKNVQISNQTNSMIRNSDFETLNEFLFNGESKWNYPEIQENEQLLYFLSGVAIKTMLVKLCGKDNAHRYINRYTEVREYECIKNHTMDLFEKSADHFPFGNTTPIWKSQFVILMSEPRSPKKDRNLDFCYFAGLVDEKYVKKLLNL